jgi:hypothetical protein
LEVFNQEIEKPKMINRGKETTMKSMTTLYTGALALFLSASGALAQSNANTITYQGQIAVQTGSPAAFNTAVFALFIDPSNFIPLLSPVTNTISVNSNGVFTTLLNFGSLTFSNPPYYLEIALATNPAGPFTTLTPRQLLTPTPNSTYAFSAGTAANYSGPVGGDVSGPLNALVVNTVPAGALSGAYGSAVNFNNAGNSFTGSFSGNGANLNNVNAATINGYSACGIPCYWNLTGNLAATLPGHFLGTLDSNPLELHVNATRILRLEPDPTGNNSGNLIGGYAGNAVQGPGSGGNFIGGGGESGAPNIISTNDTFDVIGGGTGNSFAAFISDAFIGGGQYNFIQGSLAFVGGGANNTASYGGSVGGGTNNNASSLAVVGGGGGNTAGSFAATVCGGQANMANGTWASIGGGANNLANGSATWAVIGGGANNTVSSDHAAIGGGNFNAASGEYATVPGGSSNLASGEFSFAAGQQAHAINQGAFVWADSQSASFASTANNQFLIRAGGYVGINTNGPVAPLHVVGSRSASVNQSGQPIVMIENLDTSANSCSALRLICHGSPPQAVLSVSTAANGSSPATNKVGVLLAQFGNNNAYVSSLDNNGNWTATSFTGVIFNQGSDRNIKENFSTVSPREVLDKVDTLPISRWNYKTDKNTEHLGPVAQDFHEAFGLNGRDDTHISTVDEGGVALAAIQGLNEKLEEQVKQKDARIQSLEERLDRLEKIVAHSTNDQGEAAK